MPNAFPGLAAVALVTLVSELLARVLSDAQGHGRVPAVVLALALGAIVAHLLPATGRKTLAPGLDVVKKRVLKTAIVLYGLGLTAGNLASIRLPALAVIAICLVLSLLVAVGAGALFGVSRTAKLLLGCGTAICGATAVVTIAPLVDADDDEVAFAVTTIFLFNLVALFAFPWLGHRLGMTDAAFGTWVGTAVNDTSAVVATGRAYSFDAGAVATLVKVIRTLALVPMAMGVGLWASRSGLGGKKVSLAAVFPWFVLGFAIAAALAVTGTLPAALVGPAKLAAGILVTAVLAGVGLHLDARKIAGAGSRSLALGLTIATVMAAVSLGLVRTLGIPVTAPVRRSLLVARAVAAVVTVAAVAAIAVALSWPRDPLRRLAATFDREVSPARLDRTLGELAGSPHRAGSAANRAVGDAILRRLRESGYEPWAEEVATALPEPLERRLHLDGAEVDLRERVLPEDPFSAVAATEVPYFAYCPDADVSARVVYANFGDPPDYALLEERGVPVAGKIVLARTSGSCRSVKTEVAAAHGAAGLLLYPDPRDEGFRKAPFPNGPHANPWTAQRGSILPFHRRPGAPGPSDDLPALPAQPVTGEIAERLLRAIDGPPAPEEWTGWLPAPYRLGSTRVEARLVSRSASRPVTLRNLFARLDGEDRDLPPILVSGHYDAWVAGAADPVSGAAAVLEIAEVLKRARVSGWRPRRSILFGFWDGEEPGMFGSSAWAAVHGAGIAAVLFVDSAYRGSSLFAAVTPGLRGAFDEAIRWVSDPVTGKSLLAIRGLVSLPGYSGDQVPFAAGHGTPVATLGFGTSYGLYHSVYDDPTWFRRFGDGSYLYTSATVKMSGLFAARLARGVVLPFRMSEVAAEARIAFDGLRLRNAAAEEALRRFAAAAARWDESEGRRERLAAGEARRLEERVRDVLRPFRAGADDLLLGHAERNGCAAESLPALGAAARSKDPGRTAAEAARLTTSFTEAARRLEALLANPVDSGR